jgi:hypothetical protein
MLLCMEKSSERNEELSVPASYPACRREEEEKTTATMNPVV